MAGADRTDELTEDLTGLRERNRRRPSFMAMSTRLDCGEPDMLDTAGLP
jgi:hypothetical protein